jgi:hypothetical protein
MRAVDAHPVPPPSLQGFGDRLENSAQALPHRVSMDPLDATDQGRADFKSRPAI